MSAPVLRSWRVSDAPALRDAFLTTPDLSTQLDGADLSTIEGARDFIERVLAGSKSTRNWAIVNAGSAVGNVGASAIERRHDTAWMYYWIASSSRGLGLAARALSSVADWAFAEGLYRLELGHRVNNPASCRVATGAGFVAEGIEREKLKYGEERFDVELHARLARDSAPSIEGLRLTH
ncbi:GNAT family N-acetyltransferase [Clavibacter michiganensis]|uniref:GNAT family N-acetyltransferase n=1 Tax=Clavibacter michiganensis TaxID=28447 RepID=UPI000CE8B9A5|nr:GNAT family protein [Clavibacter michiganensis]PPF55968.1 GNAT family N-acetyltransferase [Clavibacter michiganensis]PPF56431.1 GNAT family N-acetyltransferase [Clavibacter michiganensis]